MLYTQSVYATECMPKTYLGGQTSSIEDGVLLYLLTEISGMGILRRGDDAASGPWKNSSPQRGATVGHLRSGATWRAIEKSPKRCGRKDGPSSGFGSLT